MHERRGAIARAAFVAQQHQPSRRRYRSRTDTTFVSEPDAPAASVTLTVTVNERGSRITYVCPTVKLPWVVLVPVLTDPSPQSIRYVHGPLAFASLKLCVDEYSKPVTAV